MRNYYDVLGISRASSELEKIDGIDALKPTLDPAYSEDMETVLSDAVTDMHYRRLHLQYDAMAAVLNRGAPQHDSNSWSKRLVEFSPEANDLPE